MIDRVEQALRKIVLSILNEKHFGLYAYSVTSFDQAAQTLSASPTRDGSSLPTVSKVKIRTELSQLALANGSQVLIGFEGGDPAYPFALPFDFGASYQGTLSIAQVGGAVTVPVVLVPALSPAGPVPNAYSLFLAKPPPSPFVPSVGGPAMLIGSVSSGSLKVKTQ